MQVRTFTPYAFTQSPQRGVGTKENASKPQLYTGAMQPSKQFSRPNVRFGSCMCPICLSIGVIEKAYNDIGKIKAGDTMEEGSVIRTIAAQTGYDYMMHENATRLVTPALSDEQRIRIAAMNRVSGGRKGNHKITLEVPPKDSLFSEVFTAFAHAAGKPKGYHSYPKSLETVPINDVSLMPPSNYAKPNLLTIVHQMYPEDNKPQTTPVSLGYVLTRQVQPGSKELAVLSAREFPSMEQMDAAPAGVSNLLGLMAFEQYGRYETLAVVTEPQQDDLKSYLTHLKDLGIGVKPFVPAAAHRIKPAETVAITPAYHEEVEKLFPGQTPTIYQVDVRPIKKWIKEGLPAAVRQAALKADPHLEEKLPKPDKKGLSALDLLTLLRVPPKIGAKVFSSSGHHHDDDCTCHLPDMTFKRDEVYSINLRG